MFLILGEVELENLPLKKNALSHLKLPIKVYSGSIGKIKLQIPVRQFRSAPWCINIEKVYIVCGPVNLDEVNKVHGIFLKIYYNFTFSGTVQRKSKQIYSTSNRSLKILRQSGAHKMMKARTMQIHIRDG